MTQAPTFWITPEGRPDSVRLAAMLAERLKPHEQLLAYTTLVKLPLMMAPDRAYWMGAMAELLDAMEARALGRPVTFAPSTGETQSLPKIASQLVSFASGYDPASGARVIETVGAHWALMHPDVSRLTSAVSLLASWLELTQARLTATHSAVGGTDLPPWIDDNQPMDAQTRVSSIAPEVPYPESVAGTWQEQPF